MTKRLTPLKAIRAMCLQCVCGSSKEVELCTSNAKDIEASRQAGDDTPYELCPLYEFRFGKNPRRRGIGGRGNVVNLHKKSTQVRVKEKSNDTSRQNIT